MTTKQKRPAEIHHFTAEEAREEEGAAGAGWYYAIARWGTLIGPFQTEAEALADFRRGEP